MNFFFATSLTTSIQQMGSSELQPIQTAAQTILAISFLVGVYESFVGGANIRALFMTVLKCAIVSVAIQNWSTLFTDVVNASSTIASQISSEDWMVLWKQNWSQITNASSSTNPLDLLKISVAELCIGAFNVVIPIVYLIVMVLFQFLFTLWGLLLFGVGPFVLATLPSTGLSSFAKSYLKGVVEWLFWPILYAVIGSMWIFISQNNFSAMGNAISELTSGNLVSGATTAAGAVLNQFQDGLIGIVLMCLLVFLPVFAHLILKGDFAAAAMQGLRLATTAMGMPGSIAGVGKTLSNIGSNLTSASSGGSGGMMAGAIGAVGGAAGAVGGAINSVLGAPPRPTPPKTGVAASTQSFDI